MFGNVVAENVEMDISSVISFNLKFTMTIKKKVIRKIPKDNEVAQFMFTPSNCPSVEI